MTFSDLLTNLFLLLIVSIPALIVARRHEKKRRLHHPGTQPYTWGLFTGYTLTWGGALILVFSLTYPMWADPEEFTALDILGQVFYSFLICVIPGLFILRRKRWAWIWEIVTSLVLAPFRVPIDIIYLMGRWQEMKPGVDQQVTPPPVIFETTPRKATPGPLLISIGIGLIALFGGGYLLFKNIHGNAPIHHAASKGNIIQLERLLEQDTSLIGLQNKVGQTALHLAAQEGQLKIVVHLIRSGAVVDQLSRYGWTPLLNACEWGHTDVARFLLDSGADINFKTTNYGNTPLHRAANYGNIDLARLLISRGAQVSVRNNSNNTPLHRAVNGNFPDMVELLIINGADVNIKNDYGRTPLKIATEGDYRKCGRFLRENGAHN